MPTSVSPAIYWIRRDFRIQDNTALYRAAETGAPIIPVYILSEWTRDHHWTGPNRQHFLSESLSAFGKNLETIGGRLIIRQGAATGEIRKLVQESGARSIHFNCDPDPFGKSTEQAIFALAEELEIECHGYHDVSLHTPDEVLTLSNTPYRVFTPYSKNWLGLEKPQPLPKPKALATPANLTSLPLPTVATWGLEKPTTALVPPGERAARERLKVAIEERVTAYSLRRNYPALTGTSRISQDLRYGLISIRTVYAECIKAHAEADLPGKDGVEVFIKELAWREFYFAILHHFPKVLDVEFNPDWRGLPWDEPGELFDAWAAGRTGFPLVDAGMRELLATGFMHNRLRMITAMFLTKDLHLDWKQGESWFMRHLVDGEIASNNGGWQWSAGTGADAAPYFRIQNPWSQTARYDPDGIYIKRWVPELANVHPLKFLAPPADGRPLAPGYPLPCVDHSIERNRTLAIFKQHRANSQ